MTNSWGIVGLVSALFLIYCLIDLVKHRRNSTPPARAPLAEIPPERMQTESEWFDGALYVPGSPGLYKARNYYYTHDLSSGEVTPSVNDEFMLFWTGSIWLTQRGQPYDEPHFSFCGMLVKMPPETCAQ